jgi:biopolymer transport protein ExbD
MKRQTRKEQDSPGIEMTPMIDVVFQLLIFFIFAIQPMDILGHLDAMRPQPSPDTPPEIVVESLTILIDSQSRIFVNDRHRSLAQLNHFLGKMASLDADQSIVLTCDRRSRHGQMMQVLDTCAEVGLSQINITTM